MTDRATLEAIRDEHFRDTRYAGSYCAADRLDYPCPARTAAEKGLALADELAGLRDFDRRHYLDERDAARAETEGLTRDLIEVNQKHAEALADADRLARQLGHMHDAAHGPGGMRRCRDDCLSLAALAAHDRKEEQR